jgi:hypothetical protein
LNPLPDLTRDARIPSVMDRAEHEYHDPEDGARHALPQIRTRLARRVRGQTAADLNLEYEHAHGERQVRDDEEFGCRSRTTCKLRITLLVPPSSINREVTSTHRDTSTIPSDRRQAIARPTSTRHRQSTVITLFASRPAAARLPRPRAGAATPAFRRLVSRRASRR